MAKFDTRRAARRSDGVAAVGIERLDEWDLSQRLAQGAMASVWSARPAGATPEGGWRYVVKRLHDRAATDALVWHRFRQEAELGRSLSHPRLVPVLATHLSAAPYFFVMPRLEGQTLEFHLRSGWRPRLAQALWFARQAAEALDCLAQHGFRHGDVKPGNLFVGRGGHLTLLDLGHAGILAQPTTWAGPAGGSWAYLAPECTTSRLICDIRSDLYSLGVVLYEMLAGRVPLLGDCAAAHLELLRSTPPPDVRALVAGIPGDVAELISAALAKQPLRRPQTAREMIERLVSLEIRYWEAPADLAASQLPADARPTGTAGGPTGPHLRRGGAVAVAPS